VSTSSTTSCDTHGRVIDYLRISVTDRCNERCLYCMPEGYKGWAQKPDHLSADEILRIASAACSLGFRKFRLTGGEPLIRPDIVEIARRLWDLPGVQTLGLSTNGTRLATLAQPLRQAGVRSLNISLDALDPDLYHQITGGHLPDILAGIDAAHAAGFERIKLNCVLMRGVTESQIPLLLEFAAARDFPLRFIELMPLSHADALDPAKFFPVAEAMRLVSVHDELVPAQDQRIGHGPARYYRLKKAGTLVGFIGALTTPDFCGTCNKLRLTADGMLRPCLGRHGEMDLKPILRQGTDRDLVAAFCETLRLKPLDHTFRDQFEPQRPMVAIGG
jgi:cyclic pyranopterin phosphate synthase